MQAGHQADVQMGRLLLNCDLGEHESARQTQAMLDCVDAANISCGVHAGSLEKTVETLRLAKMCGVKIGAHPGMAAAGGRGPGAPGPDDFAHLLSQQLTTFFDAADALGLQVHHIKLHGSLYSAVEQDAALAAVYLEHLHGFRGVKVFALAGGSFADLAAAAGVDVIPELFADRGYQANGMLVPRSEPGALIHSVQEAVARMGLWRASGQMPTVDGDPIPLNGATICVHSDSPQALELLRALR